MTKYARGARAERLVRDELYSLGANIVLRAAGSKGPADLVAIFRDSGKITLSSGRRMHINKDNNVWLVQVKCGKTEISAKERLKLNEYAEWITTVIAHKPPRRPIEWEFL
jgi:hypothetical protein